MKYETHNNIKYLTSLVLVISLLLSSFSALIVEATNGNNNTLNESLVMDSMGNWVNTDVTYNSYNSSYTDHFESYSSTQHMAYCWCGVYELQNHSLI